MFARTHYLPASRGLELSSSTKAETIAVKYFLRAYLKKSADSAYEMYRGNCRSVVVVVVFPLFIKKLLGGSK